MNIILQIDGGIGKCIAATAVCKAIKRQYANDQAIVVNGNFASIFGGTANTVTGQFSTVVGGQNNNDNGMTAVGIFGQNINNPGAMAPNTFHVNCLNACSTPNCAIGPFPHGTVFYLLPGSTPPGGTAALFIQL